MSTAFEFKQFSLEQGKSAFKLGTDSVVLGSWLPLTNFQRVLDIGSGTGILALMMAQKSAMAKITAIELDKDSAIDCRNNFQSSKWSNRLEVVNQNVLDWSQLNPTENFDLIISNPPYFVDSLKNPDQRKSNARHTDFLGINDLTELVSLHLQSQGHFAFILPVQQFDDLEELLSHKNIYPRNVSVISSYSNMIPIRKMGIFGFERTKPTKEFQFLYNSDKTRSDWYKSISNEFYIK